MRYALNQILGQHFYGEYNSLLTKQSNENRNENVRFNYCTNHLTVVIVINIFM